MDASTTIISREGMEPVGQQISSSCGIFTTSSITAVDVTNLSVTLTTKGRPVWLGLIADNSDAYMYLFDSAGIGNCRILFVRGTTILADFKKEFQGSATYGTIDPSMFHLDPVAAGTYTYKLQVYCSSATDTLYVNNLKLVAYEL